MALNLISHATHPHPVRHNQVRPHLREIQRRLSNNRRTVNGDSLTRPPRGEKRALEFGLNITPDRVAVTVRVDLNAPYPNNRLARHHTPPPYSGPRPPLMSAPHEQYAAPKCREHTSA